MALAAAMVMGSGSEARSGVSPAPAQLQGSSMAQLLVLVKNKNKDKKKKDDDDDDIIKSTCKTCGARQRLCVIQFRCAPLTIRDCQPQPSGEQICCCRVAKDVKG
jgi:hypothetical protein